MAKRCACDMLLKVLREDARLRLLPASARGIWLELCLLMQGMDASVLRLGSEVPNRVAVARLLQIEVTELEPNLEALLAAGVLFLDRDGALMSPHLAAARSRSEINRANGAKGGRPPKRKAAPSGQGQMRMLMPIAGGRETETEAKHGSVSQAGRGTSTTTASSLEVSESVGTSEPEFVRVGARVMEEADLDPARWTGSLLEVQAWLNAGADEGLIVEAVRRVMSRDVRPKIKSLRYFTRAVMDDIAAAQEAEACRPNLAWHAALQAWQETDRSKPMPKLEDYRPRARAS